MRDSRMNAFMDLHSNCLENDPCAGNISVQAKNATQVAVNTALLLLKSQQWGEDGRLPHPQPQRHRRRWLWLWPGRCTVIAKFSSFCSLSNYRLTMPLSSQSPQK